MEISSAKSRNSIKHEMISCYDFSLSLGIFFLLFDFIMSLVVFDCCVIDMLFCFVGSV